MGHTGCDELDQILEQTLWTESAKTADFVPDIERHTRFTETQVGALVCHDHDDQKYYRNYQSEVDLDIIRRLLPRNLCSPYPDVTIRYFAQNWPELTVIAFTDTHIPIGIIIAHQSEPHVARIDLFAVERRVEAHLIYKRLMQLEIGKMREIGIRKVFIKPENESRKSKLLRFMGDSGPLRYVNNLNEFEFHI